MCFHTWALRLSCLFLANYVPKCQMSSGPYGPMLIQTFKSALRDHSEFQQKMAVNDRWFFKASSIGDDYYLSQTAKQKLAVMRHVAC